MSLVDVVISCTCGACPLQYEGTVNGYPFYYRGRWGRWYFGIGETLDGEEDGAVAVAMGFADGFYRAGVGGDNDPPEAEAIIRRCCEEWIKEGEPCPS